MLRGVSLIAHNGARGAFAVQAPRVLLRWSLRYCRWVRRSCRTRSAILPGARPSRWRRRMPALYQEFGFMSAEQAQYTLRPRNVLPLSAWRLRDSTGALALFDAQRPADATPAKLAALSAKTPDGAIFAYGNYVFQISGVRPGTKGPRIAFCPAPPAR